jgi:hypothetical protein
MQGVANKARCWVGRLRHVHKPSGITRYLPVYADRSCDLVASDDEAKHRETDCVQHLVVFCAARHTFPDSGTDSKFKPSTLECVNRVRGARHHVVVWSTTVPVMPALLTTTERDGR